MFGAQEDHDYVRLHTACEMIEHSNCYDVYSSDRVLKEDHVVTSHVGKLIDDVVTDGGNAKLIHLYGISGTFGIIINSYVPQAIICHPLDID